MSTLSLSAQTVEADLVSKRSQLRDPVQWYGILKRYIVEIHGLERLKTLNIAPHDLEGIQKELTSILVNDPSLFLSEELGRIKGYIEALNKRPYKLPAQRVSDPSYIGTVFDAASASSTDDSQDFTFRHLRGDEIISGFVQIKEECAINAVFYIVRASFAFQRVMDQLAIEDIRSLSPLSQVIYATQMKCFDRISPEDRVELSKRIERNLYVVRPQVSPADRSNKAATNVFTEMLAGVASFSWSSITLNSCKTCSESMNVSTTPTASRRINTINNVAIYLDKRTMQEAVNDIFATRHHGALGSDTLIDLSGEIDQKYQSHKVDVCDKCGTFARTTTRVLVDRLPKFFCITMTDVGNISSAESYLPKGYEQGFTIDNCQKYRQSGFCPSIKYVLFGALLFNGKFGEYGHWTALWRERRLENGHYPYSYYDGMKNRGKAVTISWERARSLMDGNRRSKNDTTFASMLIFKQVE